MESNNSFCKNYYIRVVLPLKEDTVCIYNYLDIKICRFKKQYNHFESNYKGHQRVEKLHGKSQMQILRKQVYDYI